jgi:hypothetical protein
MRITPGATAGAATAPKPATAPAIKRRRLIRLEKIRCCILSARAIAIAQHIDWVL